MQAFIVEDPRYRLSSKHLNALNNVFDEVQVYSFDNKYEYILNSCGNLRLRNVCADFSFYQYIFQKHSGAVSVMNSTLFFKHPFKYILNKLVHCQFDAPSVYGVMRTYRNGLVVSPSRHYPFFLSSFFLSFNASASARIFPLLDKCINDVAHDNWSTESDRLRMFAYEHTHNPEYILSHHCANSGSDIFKMQKYKSVVCEHLISEIILDECVVQLANGTARDNFFYKFNTKFHVF